MDLAVLTFTFIPFLVTLIAILVLTGVVGFVRGGQPLLSRYSFKLELASATTSSATSASRASAASAASAASEAALEASHRVASESSAATASTAGSIA